MTWIENLHFANLNQVIALCLSAYVLGCFTAGYYLVRFRTGKDVREMGSRSVGARNVGRVLGKTGFFLTLLFDFSKGALAILMTRHVIPDDRAVALAGIAVVAGHIWPMQLRFHGGKGMATSLGVLLAYDPRLAGAYAIFFACMFLLLHRTVLPGLVALLCVPLAAEFADRTREEIISLSALAALVVLAHRKNILDELHHLTPPQRTDKSKPPEL